jgi:hypothetical protein
VLLEGEKRNISEIKQAKSTLLQLRSWNLIKEWAMHIGLGANVYSNYRSKSISFINVNCTFFLKIGHLILFKGKQSLLTVRILRNTKIQHFVGKVHDL